MQVSGTRLSYGSCAYTNVVLMTQGIDKGKGIATEPSFGGWANEAAKNDDISWGDWGSTGEWPAASPKETKSGSTIFEPPDDPGSSKRSTGMSSYTCLVTFRLR